MSKYMPPYLYNIHNRHKSDLYAPGINVSNAYNIFILKLFFIKFRHISSSYK